MGPLANRRRLAAVADLVEDAVFHGAKVATGGKRVGNRGWFYACLNPTFANSPGAPWAQRQGKHSQKLRFDLIPARNLLLSVDIESQVKHETL